MASEIEVDLDVNVDDAIRAIKKLAASVKKQITDGNKDIEKPFAKLADQIEKTGQEAKKAAKSVDKVGKEAKESGKEGESGFKKFGDALFSVKGLIVGIGAAFAVGKIFQGIKAVTEAAITQENAINELNAALKASGEFSAAASQDLQNFASQIQQTTVFGDEAVLTQLKLAKAFGASNEQAKLIVTAATELAAATGKSLDEATRQVSKTLGGFAGELGEVNPRIKALTSEQLKAGAAAKILIDQYGGQAAAQVNTFGGSIEQLSNIWGDLLEQIGFLITKNPVVIKIVNKLSEVFQNLGSFIGDNQDEFSGLISKGLKGFIGAIPTVIKGVRLLAEGFDVVIRALAVVQQTYFEFLETLLEFKPIRDFVSFYGKAWETVVSFVIKAIGKLVGNLGKIPLIGPKLEAAFDLAGAQADIDDLATSLENLVPENLGDEALRGVRELQDTFEQTAKDGLLSGFTSALQEAETAAAGFSVELDATPDKPSEIVIPESEAENAGKAIAGEIEKVAPSFGEQIGAVIANPLKPLIDATIADRNVDGQSPTGFDIGIAAAVGAINTALKGAEGATSLVSSTLGLVADKFIPGIGGAVGEIAGVLAKGPDEVRKQVKAFTDALPQVIENIAASIPVVIETLAENSDKIIEAIVKASPKLIAALIKATPQIIGALVKNAPEIIEAIVVGLRESLQALIPDFRNFGSIVVGFGRRFGETISGFFRSLGAIMRESVVEFIQYLGNAISGIFDSFAEAISGALTGAVQGLANGIVNAGQKIAEIFSGIGASLQTAFNSISEFFSEIFTGIGDFFAGIFDFDYAGAIQAAWDAINIGEFTKKLLDGAGKFVEKFLKIPTEFVKKLVSALGDLLEDALDFLPGVGGQDDSTGSKIARGLGFGTSSGGGKADYSREEISAGIANGTIRPTGDGYSVYDENGKRIGVINKYGNFTAKFAMGGLVPQGFPNDSFPARLTSGELVIPPGDTQRLSNFLDRAEEFQAGGNQNSGPAMITVQVQIGQKQLAEALVDLERQGFRTSVA